MTRLTVTDGKVGHGVPFERLARLTGYLAPPNRWSDAKQAELRDRVKHDTGARVAPVERKLLKTDTTCAGDKNAFNGQISKYANINKTKRQRSA